MAKKDKYTIDSLVLVIKDTNLFFQNQVQKQVNVALTLRNWAIGHYLAEYEQRGSDRAEYGEQLYKNLSQKLARVGIKGLSYTTLHLCKQFYLTYPQIVQTLSEQFKMKNSPWVIDEPNKIAGKKIVPTLSEQSKMKNTSLVPAKPEKISRKKIVQTLSEQLNIKPEILVNRLSFSHFIELLKLDSDLKRAFYQVEALNNNWSVRDLQRATSSLLYERAGLSKNKKAVIEKHKGTGIEAPGVFFRNPYLLEFLGLEEKSEYTELDMEQAIIDHLQSFLLEMGRGFCFEARQKRITFDNKHYRIDLVFYHRLLRCHVLIDLKVGEFDHSDAGQMNVYLNYYKDNEMSAGDNPPVGIILCANKNENLVKYATAGLSQKVFVSKYLVNLPSESELAGIIEEEQKKLNN